MKIYVAGVMQGSVKGKGIKGQGYREIITEAVKNRYPDAEIIDPYTLYPDSVEYDNQRAKQVLFDCADEAAESDFVIAYLPEASMGTALEMIRAYDNGKIIFTITTMEENWTILSLSTRIFSSLDDFCDWMAAADLVGLMDGSGE